MNTNTIPVDADKIIKARLNHTDEIVSLYKTNKDNWYIIYPSGRTYPISNAYFGNLTIISC